MLHFPTQHLPRFLPRLRYKEDVPRISVWLPDELADQARAAGLNVSALTQQAVRHELTLRGTIADKIIADLGSSLSPDTDRVALRARLEETLRSLLG